MIWKRVRAWSLIVLVSFVTAVMGAMLDTELTFWFFVRDVLVILLAFLIREQVEDVR